MLKTLSMLKTNETYWIYNAKHEFLTFGEYQVQYNFTALRALIDKCPFINTSIITVVIYKMLENFFI